MLMLIVYFNLKLTRDCNMIYVKALHVLFMTFSVIICHLYALLDLLQKIRCAVNKMKIVWRGVSRRIGTRFSCANVPTKPMPNQLQFFKLFIF